MLRPHPIITVITPPVHMLNSYVLYDSNGSTLSTLSLDPQSLSAPFLCPWLGLSDSDLPACRV